jgi:hypothetical protein|tara:strand:- start:1777 stop:1953 length:177 start_codon:yes stop_codon:yes gene_type:complete
MLKYRIIRKEVLVNNLSSKEEAFEILEQLKSQSNERLEVEEFNFYSDSKRLGRDPDLH